MSGDAIKSHTEAGKQRAAYSQPQYTGFAAGVIPTGTTVDGMIVVGSARFKPQLVCAGRESITERCATGAVIVLVRAGITVVESNGITAAKQPVRCHTNGAIKTIAVECRRTGDFKPRPQPVLPLFLVGITTTNKVVRIRLPAVAQPRTVFSRVEELTERAQQKCSKEWQFQWSEPCQITPALRKTKNRSFLRNFHEQGMYCTGDDKSSHRFENLQTKYA